jgi:hypothetical protein
LTLHDGPEVERDPLRDGAKPVAVRLTVDQQAYRLQATATIYRGELHKWAPPSGPVDSSSEAEGSRVNAGGSVSAMPTRERQIRTSGCRRQRDD